MIKQKLKDIHRAFHTHTNSQLILFLLIHVLHAFDLIASHKLSDFIKAEEECQEV